MSAAPYHNQIDFRKIFESSPNLYLLLSPALVIIGGSNAYISATLTNREEIVGRGLFEVFPDNPDDPVADGVSNLSASLSYVLEHKKAHTMPVQKYDIRKQDGTFEERFWSPLNTPVLNEDNEVMYIIHRVEDVTELERTKRDFERSSLVNSQKIKEGEVRFYKIFNLSPVAIYMTDVADGRFLYVNRAFEQLFTMSSKKVIGKTVVELGITDAITRSEVIRQIKEKNGKATGLEVSLRVGNGEMKSMLVSTEIIELDSRKCFLVALVDITERKKIEAELKTVNKELEAFTYSVSHDLRAPLRAVTGFARILEDDYSSVLDEEGMRLLSTVSNNAVKMGMLIDDLLSFSRLGRKALQKRSVDMAEMTRAVVAEISKNTLHNAIIRTGELLNVHCDPVLMKQVLINLLGNAVKYSSKSPHPVVEIHSTLSGNEIVYTVKDNGVGFDMRYAAKLFGVFQRLHSEHEFQGTGVGLAIVQRIIHKHGGRIWAEGKVDGGATFYFALPVS